MEKKECLKVLVEDIHSVVVATVDKENKPTTRVIDMMLYDDRTVYFLTAKGKQFYSQLMDQGYISLSGIKDKLGISIKGYTLNIGNTKIDEIFEKNPYMKDLYPEGKRDSLEVFCIDKGELDYYDISDPKHLERDHFSIGDEDIPTGGYYVNDKCVLCGTCYAVCPQSCIDTTKDPVVIDQKRCLHCGSCMQVCPVQAIERK